MSDFRIIAVANFTITSQKRRLKAAAKPEPAIIANKKHYLKRWQLGYEAVMPVAMGSKA